MMRFPTAAQVSVLTRFFARSCLLEGQRTGARSLITVTGFSSVARVTRPSSTPLTPSILTTDGFNGIPLIYAQSQRWINKKKTIKKPPTAELKFDYSGDLVKELAPLDRTRPKVEYEGIEELESADDTIQKLFSIEFGDAQDVLKTRIEDVLSEIREHPADVRSYEVKIAELTIKIRNQMKHILSFRKDKWGKARLVNRIQYRHKILRRLRTRDYEKFLWITNMLHLKFIPLETYNRTQSKRAKRITAARAAASAVRCQKLEDLKAKLDKEREIFLVEKEKELQKIEHELKELGIDVPLTSPEEVYAALGIGEPYLPKKEKWKNRRTKLLEMKFKLYANRRYSKIETPT